MSLRAAWICWFVFFGLICAIISGVELAERGVTPRAVLWMLALGLQCVPLSIEISSDWREARRERS